MRKLFWLIWGTMFPYKTKSCRLTAYKELKTLLEKEKKHEWWERAAMCILMGYATGHPYGRWLSKLYFFPELYNYRPRKMLPGGLWFEMDNCGVDTRITILNTIIKQMTEKLKHESIKTR